MAVLVTSAFLMCAPPSSAQIPIPIGGGDYIERLGPIDNPDLAMRAREFLKTSSYVTASERASGKLRMPELGFKYRHVTLVVPVWTWGGEYCLFLGQRYVVIPKTLAADLQHVREADLRPPFAYRVPLGWILLPAAMIAGVPILIGLARLDARRKARARQVYLDSFDVPNGDPPPVVGRLLTIDVKPRDTATSEPRAATGRGSTP